ncbi:hypothetical protein AAVH_22306 [Aphelenchoides avenae]|nr:hypothetical protein AAVH_22306 [Aphelenchus avenae]
MENGGECITANYTTNAKLCSVGVQVNIVAETFVQNDLDFCFATYAVSAVSSDSLQNFVQANLQARNLLAGFDDPGKTCGSG